MIYQCIDGTLIESSHEGPVTHTCPAAWYRDGVYYSEETTGADTAIGIQQIKITRTVTNGVMLTSIVESTEQEIIEYINQAQNNG